jgi:hypothetical protein
MTRSEPRVWTSRSSHCANNIARNPGAGDRLDFIVKSASLASLSVWALCRPGDTPAPVLTVMVPHED